MLANINEIQKQVDEIILRAGFPKHSVNLCSAPVGGGTPYISFENNTYNYIYSERGYELSRKVTHSLNTLLYWIMSEFACQIAYQYELAHRIKGKDGRRIAFPKFIEIMANMNPAWESEARNEIQNILAEAPYDDSLYT
ncbi:immunity 63 family protein [Leclercia adecarboxylata]|uniref:Imm63 family immunity protein n=1 Tax=Leclercia adecarboxylata TaxID=83655 RepID=UPI002DB7C543|nr:Imm63 family immunity protein [Leclercia adecarboxylata]MEB6380128.1 immunity 63 family protein [Leclercia adecarboxylata]